MRRVAKSWSCGWYVWGTARWGGTNHASPECAWDGLCTGLSLFFFQAEDGIRDVAVTGVQTCALPISMNLSMSLRPGNGSLPSLRIMYNRYLASLPGDRSENIASWVRLPPCGAMQYAFF